MQPEYCRDKFTAFDVQAESGIVKSISLTVVLTSIVLPSLADEIPVLVSASAHWNGRPVSLLVQPASDSSISLTANNGFFDRGFHAVGQKSVPEDDKHLISAHFEALKLRSGIANVSARWHILTATAGDLDIHPHFSVADAERNVRWQLTIGETEKIFIPGDGETTLRYSMSSPGHHTVFLERLDNDSSGETQIKGLTVSGNPVDKGGIIRARWRPAAVHSKYSSSTCPTTNMWVFETQAVTRTSSYSPITTQFGYFGASFNSEARAAGGVNFSMWAASRNAAQAPPLTQMPHLLATGNPDAEFGGFGHEGSGVKIRNWEPYAHNPRSVIQALRLESEGGYDTFYGYLFDERDQRWGLYAVGRRPQRTGRRRGTSGLTPGSFCEIPGPPAVERSGDVRRVMRRRGWFYDADGNWHPIDHATGDKSSAPINKFVSTEEGWILMGTGGVEMLQPVREVRLPNPSRELPAYLQPDLVSQLFQLPVEFGSVSSQVTRTSAVVNYELTDAGPNAKAVLYYGPKDCLTFVARELHGTERKGVSSDILASDRVWANSTKPQDVSSGVNQFRLQNLKSGTQYFFRLLVTNERGKSWAFESGSFATK